MTQAEGIGIVCGLSAAVCHSASYVFSRLFVIQRHRAILRLLIASHLIMGVVSLLALPFVWSADVPPLRAYVWPLLGAVVFYLGGQIGLFSMVRDSDSSRVAPLLGFKIVVLALIAVLFMGQHLGSRQWLAVTMSVGATLVLSYSGGSLSPGALLGLVATCTSYSLSDLFIAALVTGLAPLSPLRASLVGVCLNYSLCGLGALVLWKQAGGMDVIHDWKYAVPFAAAWLLAMVFLFACFALVGPVYGNILQSTRGILSVLAGAWIARMGWEHLEQRVSASVFLRRIGAAAMMCAAIWLFKT